MGIIVLGTFDSPILSFLSVIYLVLSLMGVWDCLGWAGGFVYR